MSIRHSQPRHRAETTTNMLGTLSKAVSPRVGSIGRTSAVVAAAAGLTLGLAAPGQAAAPVTPADTAPASSVSVPSSNTYKANQASVSSTPAPRTTTHRAASSNIHRAASSNTRTAPANNTARAASTTSTRQAPPASADGFQSTARNITPRAGGTQNQTTTNTSDQTGSAKTASSSTKTSGIAGTALAFEGVGYSYGGETPGAWDCSGFVKYVYGQAGVDLPHNTTAIRTSGKFVETSNPSPGDLVYQNGGSHVGIYIGGGKIIGAQNPTSGTVIREADSVYGPLMGYYTLAS